MNGFGNSEANRTAPYATLCFSPPLPLLSSLDRMCAIFAFLGASLRFVDSVVSCCGGAVSVVRGPPFFSPLAGEAAAMDEGRPGGPLAESQRSSTAKRVPRTARGTGPLHHAGGDNSANRMRKSCIGSGIYRSPRSTKHTGIHGSAVF